MLDKSEFNTFEALVNTLESRGRSHDEAVRIAKLFFKDADTHKANETTFVAYENTKTKEVKKLKCNKRVLRLLKETTTKRRAIRASALFVYLQNCTEFVKNRYANRQKYYRSYNRIVSDFKGLFNYAEVRGGLDILREFNLISCEKLNKCNNTSALKKNHTYCYEITTFSYCKNAGIYEKKKEVVKESLQVKENKHEISLSENSLENKEIRTFKMIKNKGFKPHSIKTKEEIKNAMQMCMNELKARGKIISENSYQLKEIDCSKVPDISYDKDFLQQMWDEVREYQKNKAT